MNASLHDWRENVLAIGLALLVVVALPVLAIFLFVVRGLLFFAGLAALAVGLGVYLLSPRLREWVSFKEEAEQRYKGLRLSTDVSLSPGHVWARLEGRHASVGIDDLAQSALGPVDTVELPAIGRRVERGEPLFRIGRHGRTLTARAPVAGEVAAINEALRSAPERINEDPFGRGWAVSLTGRDVRRQGRELRHGLKARDWFRSEVDRLILGLSAAPALPTLPDGGVLSDALYRCIDETTWQRLHRELFDTLPDAPPHIAGRPSLGGDS